MSFPDLSERDPRSNPTLQWFHRSSGKPQQTLRMLEDALAVPEAEQPSVTAGQFVDEIDDTIQEHSRREVMSVLVHLKQREVKALVRRTAHAKGRYLAALMELPRNQATRKSAVEEVSLLRREYEELEIGLKTLRQLILDSDIDIIGVE